MEPRMLRAILFGGATVLLLVSLVTPWWTGTFEAGGNSGTESAGPFDVGSDDTELIQPAQATVAGLLMVVALLAAAAVTVFNVIPEPPENVGLLTMLLSAAAVLLTVIVVLLAPTTWPDDVGFWGTESASFFGFTVTVTTYANVGWFLAILAAVIMAVTTVMTLMENQERVPASSGTTGQRCQAVTRSGTQCTRKPQQGRYCNAHA